MKAEPLSRSRWASARWLVLAPHPDDETLGCGALIAHAARRDRLGGIVYLTDGTGSHPPGTAGIAGVRRREAGRALGRLGACVRVGWLGWPDAHPHEEDSPRFQRDAQWLAAMLRRRRIDALAVTARGEAHCDHAAAHRLARAAIRRSRRGVVLFAYHVWSEPDRGCTLRLRTDAMPAGRRRHALRAHRSQLTPMLGEGFRLDTERRRMAASDLLTLCGRA